MKNNEKNTLISTDCSHDSSVCPVCRGGGWEIYEESNEYTKSIYGNDTPVSFARPCTYCNGGHAERVKETKQRANIPSAFYDSRLSGFDWNIYTDDQGKTIDVSKQKQIVESFIEKYDVWEKRGIGLYIYSQMKGSGKTFLASCICNELIAKYPMNTKFVSASELIEYSKKGSQYDIDPIELLCRCKLLCIDDLGQKQTGSDWTNDILFRILDNRMNKKLVTIITSNISIQALQMDDRTTDRINRICSPIPLPEFCVRSREAKQNQVELFKELGIIRKAV